MEKWKKFHCYEYGFRKWHSKVAPTAGVGEASGEWGFSKVVSLFLSLPLCQSLLSVLAEGGFVALYLAHL
jgi:hypothetical protein